MAVKPQPPNRNVPPVPSPAPVVTDQDVPQDAAPAPAPAAPTQPQGDPRVRLAELARRLRVQANQFYSTNGMPVQLPDGRIFDLYILAGAALDRLDNLEGRLDALDAQLATIQRAMVVAASAPKPVG